MFSRYLFILSSKAANGKHLPTEEHIREIFRQVGLESSLEIIHTKYPKHPEFAAREFAKKWGEDGLVYACGGDGTLGEVAAGIYGTKTYMGTLPCGTANDFCKTIYGKKTWKELLDLTTRPKLGTIDLIRFNEHISLNVTSFGWDSVVLKGALDTLSSHPKMGVMAYAWAVVKSIVHKESWDLKYEYIDHQGKTYRGEGKYILGTVCNGRYYGGGFLPSPDAEIEDGILEVSLVEDMKLFEMLPLIKKYRKGDHISHPKVKRFRAVKGKIFVPDKIIANYDGELFEFDTLDYQVIPKGINFVYLTEDKKRA